MDKNNHKNKTSSEIPENETETLLSASAKAAEARRRKNRRFNRILYCIAGFLILAGVIIIIRDQTMLFDRLFGETVHPPATFPPDTFGDALVIDIPSYGTAHPTAYATFGHDWDETPTPEPTAVPSMPVSLYFEGHDLSCEVQPVGINDEGDMATVPTHDIAGWYMYGAYPNSEGNCIIAGHNRYHGQMGIFSILHKGLEVGNRLAVTLENGDVLFYRVESINSYHYTEVPEEVMSQGGEARLTLITCLGDFDYNLQMSRSRVVAICKRIG